MKALALTLSVVLVALPLAGCLQPGASSEKASGAAKKLGSALPAVSELLSAGDPLWRDPQNTPHPAYNWPTVSHPAITEARPYWKPIEPAQLPAVIRGISLLAKSPEGLVKGAGIAVFGSLVVVPGYGANSSVVDISDPAKPRVLSTFMPQEGMSSHRGATFIAYPDGRLVTVISTGRGLDVWDLTNPEFPEPLPPIVVSSHKVGVVPGTPVVYNAKSSGGGDMGMFEDQATGVTEIYDMTDPYNPVQSNFTNGFGCHHVYFWNDLDAKKFRAICAGIEFTQLWDTADPLDPKVIVSVPVHHGVAGTPSAGVTLAAFSHFAGLNLDGTILMVGDEMGGGGLPPGCVASANTPAGAVSTPIGALWFYDVSDEENPRVLGWYSPLNDPRVKAAPTTSCTAHHGRLVPAEGRDMIAMSFYGAGVVLVDFTGIGTPGGPLPRVVGQFAGGTNVWETWYNQGYLFTGDMARGMDVLKFE